MTQKIVHKLKSNVANLSRGFVGDGYRHGHGIGPKHAHVLASCTYFRVAVWVSLRENAQLPPLSGQMTDVTGRTTAPLDPLAQSVTDIHIIEILHNTLRQRTARTVVKIGQRLILNSLNDLIRHDLSTTNIAAAKCGSTKISHGDVSSHFTGVILLICLSLSIQILVEPCILPGRWDVSCW